MRQSAKPREQRRRSAPAAPPRARPDWLARRAPRPAASCDRSRRSASTSPSKPPPDLSPGPLTPSRASGSHRGRVDPPLTAPCKAGGMGTTGCHPSTRLGRTRPAPWRGAGLVGLVSSRLVAASLREGDGVAEVRVSFEELDLLDLTLMRTGVAKDIE